MMRLFTRLAGCVLVLGITHSAAAGPLGEAAKAGDIEEIDRLLNEGANVDESGLASPLFYAIQYDHTEATRVLLQRGADANLASPWGTPIHEAAKRGNAEIVDLLIEQGADLDATASREMTPLHSAAESGSLETVQVLLDHGADVDALTSLDEPPIHYAKLNGHEDVAQLLIDYGWTPPEVTSIGDLIATADLANGELLARACAGGCHTFERGKNAFGPSLWNIVGRPKGSLITFEFSPTFASLGGFWTIEDLNAYLARPAQVLPGTEMGQFRGIPDAHERADLIAYLITLSDNPVSPP